jgi:hypothetical protein
MEVMVERVREAREGEKKLNGGVLLKLARIGLHGRKEQVRVSRREVASHL